MSASNFRPSLSLVLAHEGGYINHPKDPGGPTCNGVTQRVYDAYCGFLGLKQQTVEKIKPSEISDIYNKQYWRTIKADSLPCGLDYAVFDFAVNSGVARAAKYLQKLAGVEPDGVIGLLSLTAIEKAFCKNEPLFIAQYCANRLAFFKSLPTFPVFGLGWTRRVMGLRAGVDSADNGVIDFATLMAANNNAYLMPQASGSAKAIGPDVMESYVEAPTLDGKTLAQMNDQLAALIMASN